MLFRALHHRDFTILILARTISRLGDGIHDVALAWLVLELTGSAAAMGLVLTAQIIPTLVLLLIGGAVADRWPKARVLVGSDLLRAVVVLVVAALVATRSIGLGHLVVLGVVFGLVAAMFLPAWAALIPEVVPEEDRSSANALATLAPRLAGVVGPALGAALVAIGGTAAAFVVDGASFVVSAILLLALRSRVVAAVRADEPEESTARTSVVADIRAGWVAVLGTPWIAIGIAAAAATNITLAGPLVTAVPLLIDRSLGGDVGVLGWYGTVTAAGSVLAAAVLGSRLRLRRRWLPLYGAWATIGLAAAAMGLPIGVGGLLVAGFVFGAAEVIVGLVWVNALQDHVPQSLFGRVTSLDYLGSAALMPVATVLAGAAADRFGPSPVFLAGGLVSAVFLAGLTLLPQVRAMD